MRRGFPNRRRHRGIASWPVIILCFVFPVLIPLGLVLLFIRLNNRNKYRNEEYRHNHYNNRGRREGHIYEDEGDYSGNGTPYEDNDWEKNRAGDWKDEWEDMRSQRRHKEQGHRSSGLAQFIVSLAFFFVGGLVLISGIEQVFSYVFGYGYGIDSFLSQAFVGLSFVGVGAYLYFMRNRPKQGSTSSLIVSASLFFVGGIICVSTFEEVLYWREFYGGMLSSLFVGACFIFAGFMVYTRKYRVNSAGSIYDKYMAVIGSRNAVPMDEIASQMSVPVKKAYSDVQKMINRNYFGSLAFIDSKIGYFLKNKDAYSEIPIDAEEEKEAPNSDSDEFRAILSEIKKINDNIQDPILSEQVARLESVSGKIFRAVEEDVDKRPQIQKFLDYYLPTTLKLIKTYSQLERQGANGENVTNAKIRIEDTMETLVTGYEKLLDRLYKDDVMDISSDIDVLETMMANDGYSKNKYNMDLD